MKQIHIWACAVVLLICSATVFAQDQANEIRCTGGSGCKSGFIPKFASNGGSATVNNSIVSQSGTTINVAGSETVNGGLAAAGTISAGNLSTTGNVTATGNVSANGSVGVSGN